MGKSELVGPRMWTFNLFLLFASFLFMTTRADETQSEESKSTCPMFWLDATSVDMGCVLIDSAKSYTWEDAADFCASKNATLVAVHDELQYEFLRMELYI